MSALTIILALLEATDDGSVDFDVDITMESLLANAPA